MRNRVLLLLGLYFSINIVLRLLISPSVGFDEAEMVLASQILAWGYHTPPPLYEWLQAAFFGIFGVHPFALSLLKNLLLFGMYCSLYLCAGQVVEDERRSLLASVSLFLIPTFGWDALRSQSNSVLATFMAGCTLFLTLRLLKKPSLGNYCGCGAASGLGVLSYYNFAGFAAVLGLACLSMKAGRERLLHWKAAVAALLFAIVVAPHGLWLVRNLGYTSELLKKLDPSHSAGPLGILAHSLASFLLSVLTFLGPLMLCFYWCFGKPERTRRSPELSRISSLLGITFTGVLLLCALVVVAVGATRFRDRWLEPLLFFAPAYFLTFVEAPVSARAFKKFAGAASLSALLALAILHGRVPLAGVMNTLYPLNYPARDIAAEIRRAGFLQGTIIADEQMLAGNLKLSFPGSKVVVPSLTPVFPAGGRPILVVWEPWRGQSIPAPLADFVSRRYGADPSGGKPGLVSVPYLYAKDRQAALAYVQLPPPAEKRTAAAMPDDPGDARQKNLNGVNTGFRPHEGATTE